MAVKVPSKSDHEEDSWILASVVAYDRKCQTYTVQDEDDIGAGRVVLSIPCSDVRRLDDNAEHLKRGDIVFAVFPEVSEKIVVHYRTNELSSIWA